MTKFFYYFFAFCLHFFVFAILPQMSLQVHKSLHSGWEEVKNLLKY